MELSLGFKGLVRIMNQYVIGTLMVIIMLFV
jgi:hypothetical protein